MIDRFYKNNLRFYVTLKQDFFFINLLNFPKSQIMIFFVYFFYLILFYFLTLQYCIGFVILAFSLVAKEENE